MSTESLEKKPGSAVWIEGSTGGDETFPEATDDPGQTNVAGFR